jgi:hypothetical protein
LAAGDYEAVAEILSCADAQTVGDPGWFCSPQPETRSMGKIPIRIPPPQGSSAAP